MRRERFGLRPLRFNESQRREHLASVMGNGDPVRAAQYARLPLFEVALMGADALKARRTA